MIVTAKYIRKVLVLDIQMLIFAILETIESSRARAQSDESKKKINIYFVIFVDWYIDNLTSESRNEAVPRTFWNCLGNLDEKLSCELSDTVGRTRPRDRRVSFSATFPSLICVIGETRAKACRIKPVSYDRRENLDEFVKY